MIATDAQVRKLMEELKKHGKLGLAAARAGLDRKTAAKYRDAGKLPSEMKAPRDWRTREDPFEEVWPVIKSKLVDAPELEAKTLFEWLQTERPSQFDEGQLRTLQRRVRDWRAIEGPLVVRPPVTSFPSGISEVQGGAQAWRSSPAVASW